ncbi:MAG: hypothetical protein WAQ28_13300 [Bacteroidia bacterium]
MKKCLIGLVLVCLWACNPSNVNESIVSNDTVKTMEIDYPSQQKDTVYEGVKETEYANYYIVIADTGKLYAPLFESMNSLAKSIPLRVDMMEREYNSKKDLISLPENAEDEMYAGDYFPRREPSEYLSLEYLNFYNGTSDEKTIALVAGIYENQVEAVRMCQNLLLKGEKNIFVLRSKVYIGCMH